jgi:hypothetical protein
MIRSSIGSVGLILILTLVLALPPGGGAAPAKAAAAPDDAPQYTAEGTMKLPPNYREWVYLTSGLDMNYNTAGPVTGRSTFDNVFVNPSSYRAFLATGMWPDKTTFVLELRGAEPHVSIDKQGQSQSSELHALEVHVKDAKLPGKWAFFEFGSPTPARVIARPADCYTCHEAHAAVDTTFVQFYPTLIGVARGKGTLSPEYLKDTSFPAGVDPKKADPKKVDPKK